MKLLENLYFMMKERRKKNVYIQQRIQRMELLYYIIYIFYYANFIYKQNENTNFDGNNWDNFLYYYPTIICCSAEQRPSYFIPKMPDTYILYLIDEIIERESKIEIRVLEK